MEKWKLLDDVKSVFNVLVNRPNPKKIIAVNFAVTYMCNSSCIICNIWKKYKELPLDLKNELELKEIKKIFEESKYLRSLQSIGLTGGEPFLRKDFVELCGFFIKKYPDAQIGIPTNAINPGMILEKLEEVIKKYNPKNLDISVSLDGIGKTHDKVRGFPENYNNALKLIEIVKREFPLIHLGIGFTIIPENYKDLLEVYNFSKNKDIGFGCWFGQISDFFYENSEKIKEFKWDKEKLEEVEQIMNLIIKDYRSTRKSFFQKFLKYATVNDDSIYYYLNMIDFQKAPLRKINCYSGVHSFFIDAYGNVFACIMLNKKIGNAKVGFDKIWNSEEAEKIRKFIKNKKCACWTACESFNSLHRNFKVPFLNFYRTITGR